MNDEEGLREILARGQAIRDFANETLLTLVDRLGQDALSTADMAALGADILASAYAAERHCNGHEQSRFLMETAMQALGLQLAQGVAVGPQHFFDRLSVVFRWEGAIESEPTT